MSAPLIVRTFGGLSVETPAGRPAGAAAQPRRLALLALVARAGERGITRDKLLALLWPDAEPEQGRRALNQALYALRRDLDADQLFAGVQELRLDAEVATSDVAAFDAALRAGRLEDAVAAHAGPFLDGFRIPGAPEFDRWVDEARAELAGRLTSALERLARGAERTDPAACVRWWRRLAALDPLDARVALGLMTALVAAGDRPGALQHARIYEALMAQELDLPADAAVLDLARRIRSGELAAPAPTAPAPVAVPVGASAAAPAAPPAAPALVGATESVVAPVAPIVAAAALPSVAVLPFADLSADPECACFCDGVAEEVIHALAQLPALRVVARSASFAFAGAAVPLADVAARLQVATVLEGSVRRSGARVRVTARLVDVATQAPLWAERWDGDLDDPFATQDEVAHRISARVRAALDPAAGDGPAAIAIVA